jgi:hypothetical protein
MLAFFSVSFGVKDFSTQENFLLVQSCGRCTSKIATQVFAAEAHTVFCTPNTDDRTGGVARLSPPDLQFLAHRPAQILTT